MARNKFQVSAKQVSAKIIKRSGQGGIVIHKMRLGLVFRPYLKRSLIIFMKLRYPVKRNDKNFGEKPLSSQTISMFELFCVPSSRDNVQNGLII